MITKLHIENFRCFRNFTLEGIRPITLIGGANNVGKTALLEALFFVFAYSNPDLFHKINMIRRNKLTNFSTDIIWEHFFYEKNINNSLLIDLHKSNECISLSMKKSETIMPGNMFIVPQNKELRMLPNTYPLNIKFDFCGELFTANCFLTQVGLAINWDITPQLNFFIRAKYIGIGSDEPNELAVQFGKIIKSGKKQLITESLKYIDSEIEDISTVAEEIPRLYIQKENKPPLPLSVMGNGISKLMEIICSIIEYEGGTLLIDEIETGFHHSFYPKLWEIIERLSKIMNVQIFATTHSYECTEAAFESFEDKENFCYVRLNKEEDNVSPSLFQNDTLSYAFEKSLEIR